MSKNDMSAETTKIIYSSDKARYLTGLANVQIFNIKSYANKNNLDLFKTQVTLQDGSFVRCLFVHGHTLATVFTPILVPDEKVRKEVVRYLTTCIILSSSESDTYTIPFNISSYEMDSIVGKDKPEMEFFSETYVYPFYDSWIETCPFIFTLDHKNFITVINGGGRFQGVSSRDDWHNNSYDQHLDLGLGQSICTYFNSIKMPGSEKVCFSFSPLTYGTEMRHVDRYIDHTKRLYIPILGRGVEFLDKYPKLAGCEGYAFGKKPFTITNEGIATYKESVRVSGVVPNPLDPYNNFRLSLFWPFIPYMREIPYLNIQNYTKVEHGTSGFPGRKSLRFIEPSYKHSIYYNYIVEDEVISTHSLVREDEVTGEYPDVVSSASSEGTLDPSHGIVSGYLTQTAMQGQTLSTRIKKTATIGTVGSLKDIFVETVLQAQLIYSYNNTDQITRDTNFIANYYDSGWVPDGSWPCGKPREDATNGTLDTKTRWDNIIEGSQSLKIGDIVIDSGDIALSYSGEDSTVIEHNGTTTWNRACNPCSQLVTTIDVLYDSGSQVIEPRDGSSRGPCDCPQSFDSNHAIQPYTDIYRPPEGQGWPGAYDNPGWNMTGPTQLSNGKYEPGATTPGKLSVWEGEYFYTAPDVNQMESNYLDNCKMAGLVYLYCLRWNEKEKRVENYLAATSDFTVSNRAVGGYAFSTCVSVKLGGADYNYQNYFLCSGLPFYTPPGILGYNSCEFNGTPSYTEMRSVAMKARGCCPPGAQ